MHIIDAYCGVGPWLTRDPLLPYRAEEMLDLMDHFGIAEALVYPNAGARWGNPPAVNDFALEAAGVSKRLLPTFAVGAHVHEGYPSPQDYLDRMRVAGARAAWILPGAINRGLWGWLLGDLLEALIAHRVPVFLCIEHWSPDDIHRLLSEFPALRVMLAGVGYTDDAWLYSLLRKHTGLHVCLGHYYVPPNDPERFLAQFDAGRMIFGSGLPHFSPGGLIGHVLYADIPDADKALILAGNIQRLLGEVTL